MWFDSLECLHNYRLSKNHEKVTKPIQIDRISIPGKIPLGAFLSAGNDNAVRFDVFSP